MIARGIRNNNPGNIRLVSGVTWVGQSAEQTDGSFVQFDDPTYGIRAIVRIMRSYERVGIDTIALAIDRWAPPNENDSDAYIDAVCQGCGVGARDVVSLEAIMPALVKAIILHENGQQPYTDAQIAQGVSLA
jgi:hypothetical protein